LNPELIVVYHPTDLSPVCSALTQLNLDRHNRVSTTDTRLVRRIVRDARERGYTANRHCALGIREARRETLYLSLSGERGCDVQLRLAYELSVLKPLAEPILRQVPFGTPEHVEAKRLLAFLEWFLSVEDAPIPTIQLFREFIGNSILRDFKLWHNHRHS